MWPCPHSPLAGHVGIFQTEPTTAGVVLFIYIFIFVCVCVSVCVRLANHILGIIKVEKDL